MRIAIVGGGITGLALAYYLGPEHKVCVYERSERPGGLAGWFDIEGTRLESYYHHFFKTDECLMGLIRELGIEDAVSWYPSSVGICYEKGIEPFSTAKDLLLYKHLSVFSRLVFGVQCYYLQHVKSFEGLEQYTVKEWMERHFGKQIYKQIWEPLLWAKFGEHACEVSMAWLWGRLHPRVQSREKGREKLGYINGSLGVLFDRLTDVIVGNGNAIHYNRRVLDVSAAGDGVSVKTDAGTELFDRAIVATDLGETLKLVSSVPDDVRQRLGRIEYYGAICFVMKLGQSLGDIYWINNADHSLPLSGIIEHTNFVPKSHYKDRTLIYAFRYLSPHDQLYQLKQDLLFDLFCSSIGHMFPQFSKSDVLESFCFKSPTATPVYKGEYTKVKPAAELIPDKVYMCNTAQIYPEDRSINNCLINAKEFLGNFSSAL